MTFNSLQYAAFLPLVVALYWLLPHRGRLWLLLVASYVFYGWWDIRFLALIAASTLVDFTVARSMARSDDDRHRRRLLWVSVVVNIGILGTFKYAGFFVDSLGSALDRIGLGAASPWTLGLVLPVGISFYTFQTISYTFDVHRRRIAATDDLLVFGVYVAFFPQLVAGPIERAHHLLPQFAAPVPAPSRDRVQRALLLVLRGLFKKVAVADALAGSVDAGFANASTAGWATLLIAVYAFALQIYADFSGYTDIARGSAQLLGIDLMRNFDAPYLSRSITEFWRRWHISLSAWLRDYLYIPLGGNRGPRAATVRNLLVTMVLGGLWHGAAWTFVAWGLFHGVALVVHRLARPHPPDADRGLRLGDVPAVLGTFHFVCLGWVLFRAASLRDAGEILAGIARLRPGAVDSGTIVLVALAAAVTLALDLRHRSGPRSALRDLPALARGVAYGLAAVSIVVFSGGTPVPFLYFQF